MPKVKSYYDLVHNAKLETKLAQTYTEHIIHLPGDSGSRRRVQRRERWVRDRTAPILGRGAYGIVYRETCDDRIRAVKEIRKQIAEEEEIDYMRELEAIFKFSHPRYAHCFVRSDGWFDNGDSICISMEFIENGDLQRYLTRPLCEIEAKHIISQVQEGLEFMHDNGFIHRDLKPGNIMVVKPRPSWFVKITDFGISKRRLQDTTTLLTQQRGTIAYCAPEVFGFVPGTESESSCTVAVDMWSLGVVAFSILGNSIPFKNCGELSKYGLGMRELPLEILVKQGVSDDGRDFVQKLLLPSPEARLSTKDASQHSWLSSLRDLEPGDVDNINQFHGQFVTKSSVLPASEPSASWSTPDATVALPSRPISRQESPNSPVKGSTQPLALDQDFHGTTPTSKSRQFLKYKSGGLGGSFEDAFYGYYRARPSSIYKKPYVENGIEDSDESSADISLKDPEPDPKNDAGYCPSTVEWFETNYDQTDISSEEQARDSPRGSSSERSEKDPPRKVLLDYAIEYLKSTAPYKSPPVPATPDHEERGRYFDHEPLPYSMQPPSCVGTCRICNSTRDLWFGATPSYEEDQQQQQASSSSSTSKSGTKSSRDKKFLYPCLTPGCSAKPFARHADLERHIKHCHIPDSQKDSFPCDYKKCERKSKPFHRRDHQRDHYRDYHNEDLSKRSNGSSSGAISAKAIVQPNWFRCSKCLVRVKIQENGFRCGACRTECSDERKTLRGYIL